MCVRQEQKLFGGRYSMTKPLGQRGQVFEAYDAVAGERAALRTLSWEEAQLLEEGQEVARWANSSQSPLLLGHKLLERGQYLQVCPWIDGVDLESWLAQRGPPSVREIVELFDQACGVIQALHERGFVHGRLALDKLICSQDDAGQFRVWVTGAFPVAIRGGLPRLSLDLVPHPAPELAWSAHQVEVGADIWALGVMLYQLLTGELPLLERTPEGLIAPIPSAHAPGVATDFDEIVSRCLRHRPRERFRSMRELRAALWPAKQRHLSGASGERRIAPAVGVDDNVLFTVYRPRTVRPDKWYGFLAFAHLEHRRADAPKGETDPLEEVQRQAQAVLANSTSEGGNTSQEVLQGVPRAGELTFVPNISGLEFNPPRVTLRWFESVHRAEFRVRASNALDGTTARGTVSVYLGSILLADVPISIEVNSAPGQDEALPAEPICTRPYRNIFASYSHQDAAIVAQFEAFADALGDKYLREVRDLRAGETWNEAVAKLIEQADVFQLFWSAHSMTSEFLRREWEHALTLGRENFVRPVYSSQPLLQGPSSLPPELQEVHFEFLGGLPSQPNPTTSGGAAISPPVAAPETTADDDIDIEMSVDPPAVSVTTRPPGVIAERAVLPVLPRSNQHTNEVELFERSIRGRSRLVVWVALAAVAFALLGWWLSR